MDADRSGAQKSVGKRHKAPQKCNKSPKGEREVQMMNKRCNRSVKCAIRCEKSARKRKKRRRKCKNKHKKVPQKYNKMPKGKPKVQLTEMERVKAR